MPQPDLLLVQYPGLSRDTTFSPPCAKVRMALHWKGLEFKTKNCGSPAEVRKFNPRGRVPVLVIDGERFADSSDILTELERRFEGPALEPEGDAARARARLLEDWADEVFYFQLVYLRWCTEAGWPRLVPVIFGSMPWLLRRTLPTIIRRKVRARLEGQGTGLKPLEVVLRELGEGLDMLEDLLGDRPFFCGEAPCRADLALAAELDQLLQPLTAPEFVPDFARQPRLAAWLERLHERVPSVAG